MTSPGRTVTERSTLRSNLGCRCRSREAASGPCTPRHDSKSTWLSSGLRSRGYMHFHCAGCERAIERESEKERLSVRDGSWCRVHFSGFRVSLWIFQTIERQYEYLDKGEGFRAYYLQSTKFTNWYKIITFLDTFTTKFNDDIFIVLFKFCLT